MTTTEDVFGTKGGGAGRAAPTRRTPLSSSTKFTYDGKGKDPLAALEEELADDRLIDMRADAASQFVDDVELSTRGSEGIYLPRKKIVTKAAAQEFGIAAFDDADDPFSGLPDDQPQPPSGAVVGSNVVAFTDGVTGLQKDDIEDATLFAGLAADTKWSVKENPVEWFDFYNMSLRRIGFNMQSGRWSKLSANRASFTVDEVIISVIRSMLTESQLAVANTALDAMKSLQDSDRRIVIWEQSTLDGPSDGGFNMDVVSRSPGGAVVVNSGAYAFGVKTNVTRLLWFSFPRSQTNFAASRTSLVQNERVYAHVREQITNKLGASSSAFVGTFPDFSGKIPQ